MPDALVLYASVEGHTERIAERIAGAKERYATRFLRRAHWRPASSSVSVNAFARLL